MFVILMSSVGLQNMSYDYEKSTKAGKNQKFSRRVREPLTRLFLVAVERKGFLSFLRLTYFSRKVVHCRLLSEIRICLLFICHQ